MNSVVINGDNNIVNYFKGDYVSLKEYYIPPDSVFQRVRTDNFVGREWLTAKVDAFINDPQRKSGAFLLIGDAGVGKTSFMAHLVRERSYLHLFAEQVPGQAMLQRAIQSLGSQLVTRYQIDPYKDRDTLTQLAVFPDFLERLLRLAANTLTDGERIVIVCDALDEAGTFPDGNVFGLPNVLPDGVYLILSQRPVNVKLPNIEPLTVKLEAQGADNLGDMEKYLGEVAQRAAVADQLRAKNYSDAFFIQTLKEKSLGVWMYLHYVIKEIEGGSRAPLDLLELPTGLVGYYAEYWHKWRTNQRGEILPKWRNLYAPILSTLAATQDAITVERLTQWARVKAKPDEVQALLGEAWRAFVTEKKVDGEKAYAPYHLSFRDFITGKVDLDKLDTQRANIVRDLSERTVAAHARIVYTFETECGGQWEKLVAQEYPRMHLSAHLNGAGEYEKLRILLTEGEEKIKWAEAREQKEETYAGYLNDLRYVWDYAEREQNYALAIRCMLIENSIHSLASNITPSLLTQLLRSNLWSQTRYITTINQIADSAQKAISIKLIAPTITVLSLQHELLSIANSIDDDSYRADSILAIFPNLNSKLRPLALQIIHEIRDEYVQANTLINVMKDCDDILRTEILFKIPDIIHKIKDEAARARTIVRFIPETDQKLNAHVLSLIHEIKDKYAHALARDIFISNSQNRENLIGKAITNVTLSTSQNLDQSHNLEKNSIYSLEEALNNAQKINDDIMRINALTTLAPYLRENLKEKIFSYVYNIQNNQSEWIAALLSLAPYMTNDQKEKTVSSFIAEIYDEKLVFDSLIALLPYLDGKTRKIALDKSLAFLNQKKNLKTFEPYLEKGIASNILLRINAILDKNERENIFALLIPFLPKNLKENTLKEFFSLARENNLGIEYVKNLISLASRTNNETELIVVTEALNAIKEIKDDDTRVAYLLFLTPHLNYEQRLLALSMIKTKDSYIRTKVLMDLDADPNTEDIEKALLEIPKIRVKVERKKALKSLAPHLNNKSMLIALDIAREIDGNIISTQSLIELIPHLNNEQKNIIIQEALDILNKVKNDFDRTNAILKIASFLSREDRISVFRNLLYTHKLNFLLTELIKQWEKINYSGLENEAIPFIRRNSEKNRVDGLRTIISITPAFIYLSENDDASELYRAISDISRWWQ